MRQRLNAGAFFCACRAPVPRTRCATPPRRSARRRNVFAAKLRTWAAAPDGARAPAFWASGSSLRAAPVSWQPCARAPDGFRLLAGLALRRFFIRLAALHLTKNALTLHLLFEHPESLIDIVVSNEYLQAVSNLLLALNAPSSC